MNGWKRYKRNTIIETALSIDVLACLMIKRYEKITKHAMIRRGNSILIKKLLKHEAYIINRHWGLMICGYTMATLSGLGRTM